MKTTIIALAVLAATSRLFASTEAKSGYVAHEWGTFTSVQAADGVQMEWNPLTVTELPEFVYSLAWPNGRVRGKKNIFAAKTAFKSLQRMETPVIYFYSDEPRSVDVSVNFPEGKVTEWFPQANRINPMGEAELAKSLPLQGRVNWSGVEILGKPDSSDKIEGLSTDASASHYYAARETDANPLRVRAKSTIELEKFLFYRGVGSFRAPLTITQQGDDCEALQLRNTGNEELRNLFICQVRQGRAVWTSIDNLPAGEEKVVRLNFNRNAVPAAEFHNQALPKLTAGFVREGLYEKEAKAMVKTWDDSWLAEEGCRVLYTLPRTWADRTLPLKLSPAPESVERVMVGRAELISPQMEMSLLREMMRFVDGDEKARSLAVANTQSLGLGRFAEVTMRRILASAPKTREFSNRAWELLQAVSKRESKEIKPLARN